MSLKSECIEVFRGPMGFAARVANYRVREDQVMMSALIADCIEGDAHGVIEAGTGIGKSFAYLVPLLLSGRRAIVSTATRNLQEQLFFKDLPVVAEVASRPLRGALLKGRANYFCPYRIELHEGEALFREKVSAAYFEQIRQQWSALPTGDIAEIDGIPDSSEVWPYVTSNADNCLGQQCPYLDDCPVMKARQRAQEADIVVVNHHLLFAALGLQEEGVAELIPQADVIVVDEAHAVPDIASGFFGNAISGRQIRDLAQDAVQEVMQAAGDFLLTQQVASLLGQQVDGLHTAMSSRGQKGNWQFTGDEEVEDAVASLMSALRDLEQHLAPLVEHHRGVELCRERAARQRSLLEALAAPGSIDEVHCWECHSRNFVLQGIPVDIASRFAALMRDVGASWVFTSATLATDRGLGHFMQRIGLAEACTAQLPSPFPYAENALLYVPRALPDVRQPGFSDAFVELALELISASGGRAFVLFTSHAALARASTIFRDRIGLPLFIQGTGSRSALLEGFREAGNGVLLGTGSFWEGVDVKGEALSLVIIDKLPFAAPDDPVLQARAEAIESSGQNAFFALQLPQAVIALKQGAGRLIRDFDDRGVLVVCDNRMVMANYGGAFLQALPPFRRTRSKQVVMEFLGNL